MTELQIRCLKESIPIPINIGKIEGGSWPSSVPDSLILEEDAVLRRMGL